MGRFLQIRVSVSTYDASAAAAAFPRLYALAWPVAATPAPEDQGLLELVQALDERIRLGDLPSGERVTLMPALLRAEAAKTALEAALGERDPRTADKMTYALEDALAELEKLAPKP